MSRCFQWRWVAVSGLDTLTLPVKGRGSLAFGLAHLGAAEDRWHKVAQELVAVTTLDAVVAALGLDRVDFIKAVGSFACCTAAPTPCGGFGRA
jgi:hypothetical protein